MSRLIGLNKSNHEKQHKVMGENPEAAPIQPSTAYNAAHLYRFTVGVIILAPLH